MSALIKTFFSKKMLNFALQVGLIFLTTFMV